MISNTLKGNWVTAKTAAKWPEGCIVLVHMPFVKTSGFVFKNDKPTWIKRGKNWSRYLEVTTYWRPDWCDQKNHPDRFIYDEKTLFMRLDK
jgi:hypothetical protein